MPTAQFIYIDKPLSHSLVTTRRCTKLVVLYRFVTITIQSVLKI